MIGTRSSKTTEIRPGHMVRLKTTGYILRVVARVGSKWECEIPAELGRLLAHFDADELEVIPELSPTPPESPEPE